MCRNESNMIGMMWLGVVAVYFIFQFHFDYLLAFLCTRRRVYSTHRHTNTHTLTQRSKKARPYFINMYILCFCLCAFVCVVFIFGVPVRSSENAFAFHPMANICTTYGKSRLLSMGFTWVLCNTMSCVFHIWIEYIRKNETFRFQHFCFHLSLLSPRLSFALASLTHSWYSVCFLQFLFGFCHLFGISHSKWKRLNLTMVI